MPPKRDSTVIEIGKSPLQPNTKPTVALGKKMIGQLDAGALAYSMPSDIFKLGPDGYQFEFHNENSELPVLKAAKKGENGVELNFNDTLPDIGETTQEAVDKVVKSMKKVGKAKNHPRIPSAKKLYELGYHLRLNVKSGTTDSYEVVFVKQDEAGFHTVKHFILVLGLHPFTKYTNHGHSKAFNAKTAKASVATHAECMATFCFTPDEAHNGPFLRELNEVYGQLASRLGKAPKQRDFVHFDAHYWHVMGRADIVGNLQERNVRAKNAAIVNALAAEWIKQGGDEAEDVWDWDIEVAPMPGQPDATCTAIQSETCKNSWTKSYGRKTYNTSEDIINVRACLPLSNIRGVDGRMYDIEVLRRELKAGALCGAICRLKPPRTGGNAGAPAMQIGFDYGAYLFLNGTGATSLDIEGVDIANQEDDDDDDDDDDDVPTMSMAAPNLVAPTEASAVAETDSEPENIPDVPPGPLKLKDETKKRATVDTEGLSETEAAEVAKRPRKKRKTLSKELVSSDEEDANPLTVSIPESDEE